MVNMKRVHIIPDQHIPFHDKRAWELQLQVIKTRKPDVLVIMGDFADFYSVTSHQKSPEQRNLLLQDEVKAVRRELDRLDAMVPKGCRKVFIQGNHEQRLDRYIAQRAPELFGMTSTEQLFKLAKRGWEYVKYHDHIKIGKVFFTHDTGKAGSGAHLAAERAFSNNAVIGHTHRVAFNVVGNAAGTPHVAAMFGWGGSLHAAEYMHLINARRDWALGFGTGHLKPDGVMFMQPHPIVNYECCVDGVLYSQSAKK